MVRPGAFSVLTARAHHACSALLTQLLAALVVATLLPLGVSFVQVEQDKDEANRRATENAVRGARLAAAQVMDLIGRARGAAHTIEQTPAFWSADDAARDGTLRTLAESEPFVNAFVFANADLQEHGSSNHVEGTARVDLSGREYALQARATGQMAVTSAPLASLGKTSVVLPAAVPLHPVESIQSLAAFQPGAILIAGLNVNQLPDVWANVPLPDGSTLMLVDLREGRVLTGSNEARDLIGHTLLAANVDLIRQGVSGWVSTPKRGPEQRLRVSAVVDGTPWTVVVDIPRVAVFGTAETDGLRRTEATGAAGLVIALGLLLVWRRLLVRVRGLQEAAALDGGGLDTPRHADRRR